MIRKRNSRSNSIYHNIKKDKMKIGINLLQETKDLYYENDKILMKE